MRKFHGQDSTGGGYPLLARWSEQIRMCAGADQVQVVTVDLVDQQPIRVQVTVAVVLPNSSERVVFVVGRKRVALTQQQDQFAQLRHIFRSPLG